jgi:hypothetical protein
MRNPGIDVVSKESKVNGSSMDRFSNWSISPAKRCLSLGRIVAHVLRGAFSMSAVAIEREATFAVATSALRGSIS